MNFTALYTLDKGFSATSFRAEKGLSMHYIFIDYENIQPKNLNPLMDVPCQIFIFVGARQNKLPSSLVTQMQDLGTQAQFIRVAANAKDALDIHIAYYIGQITAQDKKGVFHILSNDKGYDPLIKHLTQKKIRIQRRGLRSIPLTSPLPAPVISRPRKLRTDEKIKKLLVG